MKEKDFLIKEIYTPFSVAREELARRQNDEELKKKIDAFNIQIPDVFNVPRAVISRQVVTPNREFEYFFELANILDLHPLGWEYLHDKFYTFNESKLYLAKMYFLDHFEEIECSKHQIEKIVDFKENKIQGREIAKIKTLWGENLVDFHHRILLEKYRIDLFDATKWYENHGGTDLKEKYKYIFSLFIRNGILFEDFFLNEKEKEISTNVIIPAFKEVENLFGVRPLIVQLIPEEKEEELFWFSYKKNVLKHIPKIKDGLNKKKFLNKMRKKIISFFYLKYKKKNK